MLRRVIEGCGLALVIVMLGHRLGAGALFPVLMIVGLVAFTGWRVRGVWKRYQQRIVIQSYRPKPDSAIANEMDALRKQQLGRGAELTFWTGFIMGGAMANPASAGGMGGDGGEMGAAGMEGGMDIGGGLGDM
jgi:hypothetical protein